MYVAKYLLSVEEFMDKENGEALLGRAFLYVDEERERKARRIRPGQAQAASLGAGLLLQVAVREAMAAGMHEVGDAMTAAGTHEVGNAMAAAGMHEMGDAMVAAGVHEEQNAMAAVGEQTAAWDAVAEMYLTEIGSGNTTWNKQMVDGKGGLAEMPGNKDMIKRYSVKQLLESLRDRRPVPLAYVYGKEGKPYFKDLPFYFNLSHSGSYVLCVISAGEIGADIQQHSGKTVGKLARRFFTERECMVLERTGGELERAALEQLMGERERLFYRLWARKEAYGKLTGKGIVDALGMDMLPKEVLQGEALPGESLPIWLINVSFFIIRQERVGNVETDGGLGSRTGAGGIGRNGRAGARGGRRSGSMCTGPRFA